MGKQKPTRHRMVGTISVPEQIPPGGRMEMTFVHNERMQEAAILLRKQFALTPATVTQVGEHGFHYKFQGQIVPTFVTWENAKGGRF